MVMGCESGEPTSGGKPPDWSLGNKATPHEGKEPPGHRYRVTKEITFCYGHRLLNYNGKCRNLHGHNGRAVITLEVHQLDSLGMAFDFSAMKRTLGRWIDDSLDHRMILHADDPILPELYRQGEPVVTLDVNPTAENLARLIYEQAIQLGLPVVEVILWETETSYATYRRDEPTPGLV
jgi:6-pyruvoyltetrahydropterin/6-carboxytetrahydropterin synthase